MAAWKLLKFLSHATGTRNFVCTARNRLRGARLILSYEICILILTTLCNFHEENGYILECFVKNVHICKTLHEFYFE